MVTRRTLVKGAIAVLVAGLAAVWVAGEALIPRTNPAQRYDGVILTPEADRVLRRACFDCHSNETRFPAYSYLPIVSLLLANHVREGRDAGNYSEWGDADPDDRKDSIEDTLREIRTGRMPLPSYLWMHPEARLTPADLVLLNAAALKVYGVTGDDDDAVPGKKAKRK